MAHDSFAATGRALGEGSTVIPLSEALVRGSFFAARELGDEKRRADAEARLDAYEDDFAKAVRDRISSTYESHKNVEDLLRVLDTTNNPLKRIVNEVSTLYTRPPVWKFADPGTAAIWRDVTTAAGAPVVMPRLNRMVNLLNTVLVYIRPGHDSLTFRLVLPQDCAVWPDPNDPTMPFAVEFREIDASSPNAGPVYHQWDRRPKSAGYRKYNAKGEQVEALKNPYFDWTGRNIIPLVAYHREWPTWSFWDSTSGTDLYELTIMLAMWETWINHLIRTDSHRQKYVTGMADVTEEQQGGTQNVVQFRGVDGVPISVGEFSSQADWNGIGGQVKRKLDNVLSNSGLVLPDSRTSGDPTSGFALMVRSQGLTKIQQAQVPSYRKSDTSLYGVASVVWNFERTNAKFPFIQGPPLPAPNIAKPQIIYAGVETAKTVEERGRELENDQRRIEMGLASPITVYLEHNPDATEEEARAAIERNRADTAALAGGPVATPESDGEPTEPGGADEPAPEVVAPSAEEIAKAEAAQIFGYHLQYGVAKLGDSRKALGLPPDAETDGMTVPEYLKWLDQKFRSSAPASLEPDEGSQ